MKRTLAFMLLLTCAFAVECISSPGNITITCSPETLELLLDPGQSGTASFQCCFVSESDPNLRVLVHNRNEWFIELRQPDGSYKTIQELFPAAIYVTDILAPENATSSQVFEVNVSFQLPQSFVYETGKVDAGIEILIDTEIEQDPYSHVVISLKGTSHQEEPPTPPAENQPPTNPVQQIINTVNQILRGGGGGGGGGAPQTQQQAPPQETGGPQVEGQANEGGNLTGGEPYQPINQPEVKIALPKVVQEITGITDLSLNYILLGAGVMVLIVGIILYVRFRPL